MLNVQKHVNSKYCSSVVHVAVVGGGGRHAGETEKQYLQMRKHINIFAFKQIDNIT